MLHSEGVDPCASIASGSSHERGAEKGALAALPKGSGALAECRVAQSLLRVVRGAVLWVGSMSTLVYGQAGPCRFCGQEMVLIPKEENGKFSVSHRRPLCPEFIALVGGRPPDRQVQMKVIELDLDEETRRCRREASACLVSCSCPGTWSRR